MASQKPYTSYNSYYIILFLLWVVVGGILQYFYTPEELFKAVNLNYSSTMDVLMYYFTMLGEGVVTTLVLLILLGISAYRNWWYFIAALASNLLPSFLIQYIKSSVGAPRPLKYFAEADWIHILPHWQHAFERSFPSGHTTSAFCFFTFISFLLTPRYRPWAIAFFALALTVAYSRMYLAVHFFADVYVGSIIGTAFTMLVFLVMNKYQAAFFKKNN